MIKVLEEKRQDLLFKAEKLEGLADYYSELKKYDIAIKLRVEANEYLANAKTLRDKISKMVNK